MRWRNCRPSAPAVCRHTRGIPRPALDPLDAALVHGDEPRGLARLHEERGATVASAPDERRVAVHQGRQRLEHARHDTPMSIALDTTAARDRTDRLYRAVRAVAR